MGLMKDFCWRIFEGILGGSFSNFQVQAAVFSIKARLDPLPAKPQRLQLINDPFLSFIFHLTALDFLL